MFLGCPLQGTRAGNAAQWHTMISGILRKHPSRTLLQDLNGSTKALFDTTHYFAKMIKTAPMQMMTACFWETQRTQILKGVPPARLLKRVLKTLDNTKAIVREAFSPVEKQLAETSGTQLVVEDSATITGNDKWPLDASHVMMNKFFGPSDANFHLVGSVIRKMVEKAHEIALNQREGTH